MGKLIGLQRFFVVGGMVVILSVVAYRMVLAAAVQPETKASGSNLASKHSGVSKVTEFDGRNSEDADATFRRHSREKRMTGFLKEIKDPGKLVEGEQESITMTFLDYVGEREAFPFATSAVVATGTVQDAEAFVSQDHTYVYSDFTVTIDSILKQDNDRPVGVGQTVLASRAGGSVHFGSGHLKHFLVHGEGLPDVGEQYVLFLWRPAGSSDEFQISTAYLVKNGRMQSLDDGRPFNEFDDMVVAQFLEKLAIAQKGAQ